MTKPLPIFEHMPRHIKNQIVENTDILSRMRLEGTCHELRKMAVMSEMHFNEIGLRHNENSLDVHYFSTNGKRTFIQYTPNGAGSSGRNGDTISNSPFNYIEFAMDDLKWVLDKKDVKVERLSICTDGGMWDYYANSHTFFSGFERCFKKPGKLVHVEKIQCVIGLDHEDILRILPYVEPGILRRLIIGTTAAQFDAEKLHHLEQWKQLEKLIVGRGNIPFDSWKHCVSFHAFDDQRHFTFDQFQEAIENAKEQGDRFEECIFYVDKSDTFMAEMFIENLSKVERYGHRQEFYQLPNGNDYLEIGIRKNQVTIQKRKQVSK